MFDIFFIFYFYFFFFFLNKKKKFVGHRHPLRTDQYIERYQWCDECNHTFGGNSTNYYCEICYKWWHRRCIATSSELVNHPYHPSHTLKLLVGGAPDYTDGKCDLCKNEIRNCVYHCSKCNFSLDVSCGNAPQRLKIEGSKCHSHPLTVMVRQVNFICNACGTHGECNPYVCVACSFMVHGDCAFLPHVININRHDHRISHTYSLEPRDKICRVCRLVIYWIYGAYSCSKCPDFFVHSKCATSKEVWDGEELEGIPEEEEEEPMFKMIEDGVINHVKHPSHNLRLTDNDVLRDQGVRCELCEGLVYSDNFYSCMGCDYFLHETCAHFPSKKRLCFSSQPLSLNASMGKYSWCMACKRRSISYKYVNHHDYRGKKTVDLRCAAIDWSCEHECHPHTLFLTNLVKDTCGACNSKMRVLRCIECKFNLCYKCATYPKKVKHRCDDHPLVLRFGDKDQHGINWCTVCEAKIDLQRWFYECEECDIFCHVQCVLGDFLNQKPTLLTTGKWSRERKVQGVVSNNGSTRPRCRVCGTRCRAPFILRIFDSYICSLACSNNFPKTTWISQEADARGVTSI